MKKHVFIYGIFTIFTIIMSFFIINNIKNINSDVYELLQLDFDENKKNALQHMQKSLSKDVSFLSNDADFLNNICIINNKYQIFQDIKVNINKINCNTESNMQDFQNIISNLRIITLNYDVFYNIINNDKKFFNNLQKDLFNQFALRVLPISDDFFNLASFSSLINNNNMKLDLQNSILYIESNNKKYYFANATLKDNYDSNLLLKSINEIRNLAKDKDISFIAYSPAIFAAEAKHNGNIESIYMSIISIILLSILLFVAFGNLRIFYLLIIIIFSFLCGLSSVFLIYNKVHLLSIVISTSLAGLILDFSMHYLGFNYKQIIKSSSIVNLKKIFIIGVCITAGGYVVFFFSPMKFLHEIAVISVFTLIGAFFSTYFLLPHLLNNTYFYQKRIFRLFVIFIIKNLKFNNIYKKIFTLSLFIFISIFGIIKLSNMPFDDNIKNYSSMPQNLVNEAKTFLNIMQNDKVNDMIILRNKNNDIIENERNFINNLKNNNLIKDYDGLSKFFLSQAEQEKLKEKFIYLSQNKEFIKSYEYLGFSEIEIEKSIEKNINIETLSIEKLFKDYGDIVNKFDKFVIKNKDEYLNIIFLKDSVKNEDFYNILESYNAEIINFNDELNTSFTIVKKNAIYLKIISYILAFVILSIFFGIKKSLFMISLVLFANFLTACIFGIFDFSLDIFAIFGLILAGAVGIDYMLFSTNSEISRIKRIFSIILASLTSIISFFMLTTSNTNAVFSFGLSASLTMLFCAIFSIVLTLKFKGKL